MESKTQVVQAREVATAESQEQQKVSQQESDSSTLRLYAYKCPYCQQQVNSHVATGQVRVSGQHCGARFRVHNGEVSRRFFHSCPTCQQEVASSKPLGQIKVPHKKPNGKKCPTQSWYAKRS